MKFTDRAEAGRLLAAEIESVVNGDVVVLGLPRGGIPVARPVADAFAAPLDALVVRKIGVPGQPELAMGAVASGGVFVRNDEVIDGLGISQRVVDSAVERGLRELAEREMELRGSRPSVPIAGRTAIVVDDGVATGSTMLAAVRSVRERQPFNIVVAVPIAAPEALVALRVHADDVFVLRSPSRFVAVGHWYEDFEQLSMEATRCLLVGAATNPSSDA